MLGAAILVFVIVAALPMIFLMTGAVVSAVLGSVLGKNAEDLHPGSYLIDLD